MYFLKDSRAGYPPVLEIFTRWEETQRDLGFFDQTQKGIHWDGFRVLLCNHNGQM